MSNSEETYHLIEKYLKGDLDQQELHAFEKELAENPELQYQVQLQGLANKLVIKNRLAQVEALSLNLKNKQPKPDVSKKIIKLGVIALLVGTSLYVLTDQLHSPNRDAMKKQTTADELAVPTPNTPHISKDTGSNGSSVAVAPAPKPKLDNKVNSGFQPNIQEQSEQSAVLDTVTTINHSDRPVVKEEPRHTETKESVPHIVDKEVTNPCKNVLLKAQIQSFETCAGEEEGSISIAKINGGHEPYQFKIVSKSDYKEKSQTHLPAGKYSVTITDSKNCSKVIDDIVIKTKNCNVDVHFNPLLDETWQIPEANQSAILSIYNAQGRVIYTANINSYETAAWDGKTLEGKIESGVFVYLLKYADGSQKQGNITILK